MAVLFVLPTVIILVIIVIFPLLYSLNVSFRNYDIRLRLEKYPFVGLENYARMFKDSRFLNSLVNTVFMIMGELSLQFFIGLGLALLFIQEFKGKKIILPLIMLLRELLLVKRV